MGRLIICLIFISTEFFQAQVRAQDSIANNRPLLVKEDLLREPNYVKLYPQTKVDSAKLFKPNPTKAVLYALIPGVGQIYNKKYWKLPIIYGGFLGLSYAITWNGKFYKDYSQAYAATMSTNPWSDSNKVLWEPFLPYGTTPDDVTQSELPYYQSSFKRKKDTYRRQRDLSIIGAVALYGACIIDAYVDAQLFNFDISPDLSMHVEPTMMSTPTAKQAFGLQCSINF